MLYELKPTICVVTGAVEAILLEPVVGKAAALLLITAGVLIYNLRLLHRTK